MITHYKIKFIFFVFLFLTLLFSLNDSFRYKYVNYTLQQLGFVSTDWNKGYEGIVRYYSKEHEDLSYTALTIFRNNILNGTGIKTFYKACNELKLKNYIKINDKFRDRNNKIKCSTHPHNIYFQILSDSGIFTFTIVIFVFLMTLFQTFKILIKKIKKISKFVFIF